LNAWLTVVYRYISDVKLLYFQVGNARNRNEVKYITAADAVLSEGRMYWLDLIDPERKKTEEQRFVDTKPKM
jgi:hypothetical protein